MEGDYMTYWHEVYTWFPVAYRSYSVGPGFFSDISCYKSLFVVILQSFLLLSNKVLCSCCVYALLFKYCICIYS